jgi:multidrug efflux system outer membrane protein
VNPRPLLAIPVLLALTGCAVGPDYTPPVTVAPERWSQPDNPQIAPEVAPVSAWWTTFNDPVLDSLITRAVEENHDLRLAAARVREARAQRGVTASEFGPRTDATGGASRSRRSENTPQGGRFGDPESSDFSVGFDMTWELDFWGRIRRSVEASDADIGAAIADRDAVLVTLLGDVGRNYAELRGFQQRQAVTRKNVEVQESALTLTRKRFDAGLTTELDVQQAATQVATTRAALPPLESGARRAIYRLGVLVGRDPGTLLGELTPEGAIPVSNGPAAVGLPSDLLRRRPDIAFAERQLAAATARIGVAVADYFPRFDLAGSLGLQSDRLSDLSDASSRFWSIGPGVRWPILDWGRIRSNVNVQNARTEQALIRYERTVLTSFEEVDGAMSEYTSELARASALQEAVDAARRAVALAEQQYQSGLRDFLNVLTTQRAQFEAEDQLVASRQRVSTNLIAVYKALGGGWDVPFENPAR